VIRDLSLKMPGYPTARIAGLLGWVKREPARRVPSRRIFILASHLGHGYSPTTGFSGWLEEGCLPICSHFDFIGDIDWIAYVGFDWPSHVATLLRVLDESVAWLAIGRSDGTYSALEQTRHGTLGTSRITAGF
jgi:hypothetical protein